MFIINAVKIYLCREQIQFLLLIIKFDKRVDVVDLLIGGAEFDGQRSGGGSQRFLGQKGVHLPLDCRLLGLQLPYSQSGFLEKH